MRSYGTEGETTLFEIQLVVQNKENGKVLRIRSFLSSRWKTISILQRSFLAFPSESSRLLQSNHDLNRSNTQHSDDQNNELRISKENLTVPKGQEIQKMENLLPGSAGQLAFSPVLHRILGIRGPGGNTQEHLAQLQDKWIFLSAVLYTDSEERGL